MDKLMDYIVALLDAAGGSLPIHRIYMGIYILSRHVKDLDPSHVEDALKKLQEMGVVKIHERR